MKQVIRCPICNNELISGYKGAESLVCGCTYLAYHTVWISFNSLEKIISYLYTFPYKEYNIHINADYSINKFAIYLIEDGWGFGSENKSTILFESEWKEFESFDYQKEFATRIVDLIMFT